MQIKELAALIANLEPEMEVVILDYGLEFYAGVEDTHVKEVFPFDGEGYSDPEPAFVLRLTNETVAADKAFTPN